MRRFRGGVHPHDAKNIADKPIENATLPPKVVIPLQQHIGAPAQPIVTVGAEVKKGQKIGESSGLVSSTGPCQHFWQSNRNRKSSLS